jgi:hypothetical protein
MPACTCGKEMSPVKVHIPGEPADKWETLWRCPGGCTAPGAVELAVDGAQRAGVYGQLKVGEGPKKTVAYKK